MNRLMMKLLAPYMAPEGADGSSNGGGDDRGDDFTPTAEELAEAGLSAGAPKTETTTETTTTTAVEEEEEEEEDDKTKPKAEDEGKKTPKKDSRIPVARHKEILERERSAREAAEVELKKLREGQKAQQINTQLTDAENRVTKLEEEYNELLAEGKTKEATATMREIRQLERSITEQQANFKAEAARVQAVEQVRFDTVVERLEVAYPQLKPGTEEFDAGLVSEVLEMKEAFELKGYAASAALQKAVSYVIKPETAKQESATTATPRVDASKAEQVAKERTTEARKRNAAAANAQPPSLAKAGQDSDKSGGKLDAKTVIKMNFDDFSKLSDADLARMRGDDFA